MTDPIKGLEDLEAAATPGPWEVKRPAERPPRIERFNENGEMSEVPWIRVVRDGGYVVSFPARVATIYERPVEAEAGLNRRAR